MEDAIVAQINDAWLEHEVVFFRNQRLTPDDHIRISERLGASPD